MHDECLLDQEVMRGLGIRKAQITEFLPIWRHRHGAFVDAKIDPDTEEHVLYSDCGKAMRECVEHIRAHMKLVRETTEKNQRRTEDPDARLYQFNEREDISYVGNISKAKTFQSIFFNQKTEILPVLTAFKAGTLYPKHLPIDNKLGILLHGPPGTGKTGFISALANFLGRDVLLVHTSRLRTRKDLDRLLADYPDKIYVFEEFDCMPGVQRRVAETPALKPVNAPVDPLAMMMMMSSKEKDESMMEEYRRQREQQLDKLDLGYLLSKLDGIETVSNRIIVATTNYPERIDPALLRPGRFGLQLHMTNCTRTMLLEILTMAYQLTAGSPDHEALADRLEDVADQLWSPAELLQLVISKPGLDAVVEHLVRSQPIRL